MPLTAILRAPSAGLAHCALTFLDRHPIDISKALLQHRAYAQALEKAGVTITLLPPDPSLPDSPFVEDAALILPPLAILTRPHSPARQAEIPPIAAALAPFRPLAHITPPATVEAGDILPLGRTLFVGLSARTNHAGFAQIEALIQPFGFTAIPVEVTGCLHLKTAVTAINSQTLLLNPAWLNPAPFSHLRQIRTHPQEPFAANTLTIGPTTHLSARHPRTQSLLASVGYSTSALDISEFEKAEAGLTCLSLLFETSPPIVAP